MEKLLVIQIAGLGYNWLQQQEGTLVEGLDFQPLKTVFPAVTCPFQASFRTATPPSCHGMIANGLYHRSINQAAFWEQSSTQIEGARIWEDFRKQGKTVGMLFWQQSLGEDVDILLSPAPIHKHHGGMILDCYSKPNTLYADLCKELGTSFPLKNYWGPLASAKSGDWIAKATCALLKKEIAPDLCLTYLPTLDYDLQRHGPNSRQATKAFRQLATQLTELKNVAGAQGYNILIVGDYAITEASNPVYPNRVLHEAGLFKTRLVRGMQYPNFNASSCFAMCDHQIAHVYVRDASDIEKTLQALKSTEGIESVYQAEETREVQLNHANSGELILVAAPGYWFAYPWWKQKREAPDYASHVDIHNKPGYDPCELFGGFLSCSVSQDAQRVRGSHGRSDIPVAWVSDCINGEPTNIVQLAGMVKNLLDKR